MTDESMIQALIDRGALFVVNHSGGRDSQAMFIKIRSMVPKEQILVIHAHLPEVEWDGVIEHIHDTCQGFAVKVVTATKTFFEMVRHRQMWPSASTRQCTSDLKRGPIEKAIRHELKVRGLKLVVNCMGLRAQESPNRAKKRPLAFNARNSKAGREWYDWLPVHHYLLEHVIQVIEDAGERMFYIYYQGMRRCSCCFCIFACVSDLQTAARLNPDLYARYVELEAEIGHTLLMPKKGCAPRGLEEVTGIKSGQPVFRLCAAVC